VRSVAKFRCLTDTIILDDFKTALDRLRDHKLRRLSQPFSSGDFASGAFYGSTANRDGSRPDMQELGRAVQTQNNSSAAPVSAESAPLAASHRKASVWSEDDATEHIDLEAALRQRPQDD
jgi:hypothetical protein